MREFARRAGYITKDFITRTPENYSLGVLFIGGMLGTVGGVMIDAVTNNFPFAALPDGLLLGFLLFSRLAASIQDGTEEYYRARLRRRR